MQQTGLKPHSIGEMYSIASRVWDEVRDAVHLDHNRVRQLLTDAIKQLDMIPDKEKSRHMREQVLAYKNAFNEIDDIEKTTAHMVGKMKALYREPTDSQDAHQHIMLGLVANASGTLRSAEGVQKAIVSAANTLGMGAYDDFHELRGIGKYCATMHAIARNVDELLTDPQHIQSVLRQELVGAMSLVPGISRDEQISRLIMQANLVVEQDKEDLKVKREKDLYYAKTDVEKKAIEEREIHSLLSEVPNALDAFGKALKAIDKENENPTSPRFMEKLEDELFHARPRVHMATGQLPADRSTWGQPVPRMNRTVANILSDATGDIMERLQNMIHPEPSRFTTHVKSVLSEMHSEQATYVYDFLARVQPMFAMAEAAQRTVRHHEEAVTR